MTANKNGVSVRAFIIIKIVSRNACWGIVNYIKHELYVQGKFKTGNLLLGTIVKYSWKQIYYLFKQRQQ